MEDLIINYFMYLKLSGLDIFLNFNTRIISKQHLDLDISAVLQF